MSQSLAEFAKLLRQCEHSAVHLETRDAYAVPGEHPAFDAWLAGERKDWDDRSSWWRDDWHGLIQNITARGVTVRRARVVGEPASDYIKWEHNVTYGNVACGEDVRWLPRRQASDLLLPGNDFWLFDGKLVQFNVFDGDGRWMHTDFTEDAGVAARCADMFEAVWERAVPHNKYNV
ncbi:DUF6879 family protein [Streptomyces sp. NBC_00388]|uniref:DUF6879 family protein n=1 Tax=Streptomyces sp. NBC_00388 TaxID=2975735 RepID=UPI002E1B8910|nr:DUF6879 family protein [Streptomyces sp. NBC_00388]